MPSHQVILIVEDDADWLEIYSNQLATETYHIVKARTINKASKLLADQEFAVVATDLRLLGSNTGGFDILEMVQNRSPDTQVIIFTGFGGKQDAFEAMRRGAYDYVTKPLDYDHVKRVIRAAIDVREQKLAYRRQSPASQKLDLPFPQKFVGSSRVIKNVLRQVAEVIRMENPVLIWGASGTGKALITETIHLASPRKRFILINCGVFSETTLERNLFGFRQGAFLGAAEDQQGLLEEASGGTLVLDRISSLSPRLQDQFFSALYHQRTQRIGDSEPIDIDVRVLATSPVDLSTYVAQGLFSTQLYEFLSNSVIKLPLLKDRRDEQTDDVLLLAGYFLDKYDSGDGPPPTISESARRLLQAYDFPRNVWELEEAIRIAVIKAKSGIIEPHHLPQPIYKPQSLSKLIPSTRPTFPNNVLCPCQRLLSEQAETIAHMFDSQNYVYAPMSLTVPRWYRRALEEVVLSFGLKLYDPVITAENETFCELCQPIFASQVVVIDIAATPTALYDLGLVHALGIPYIALKRRGSQLPEKLTHLTFLEYDDEASLRSSIQSGLNQLVEMA